MPISTKHPKFEDQEGDWEVMRDALGGEKCIRKNIQTYLPPPPGMNLRGTNDINDILGAASKGVQSRYSHYSTFAEWPEITQQTLNALQGLVHEKPPSVKLPKDMEYLLESATPQGDTLNELWETVTRETLSTGRIVLLSEVYDDALYICPYVAESMINWFVKPKIAGGGPQLIVLQEVHTSASSDDIYKHEEETQFRELELHQPVNENGDAIGSPMYRVRLWAEQEHGDPERVINKYTDSEGWVYPRYFGKFWGEIPLTVNNADDRTFKLGAAPLIGAARRAISIFRKTADYYRSLYNKSDPQAVLFGVSKDEAPESIGGSSIWCFEETGGSAEYMDIDGDGIPLQRQCIADLYERFTRETGQLLDSADGGVESGEALRRKAASHQVTLKSIVINAAASVQAHLRMQARLRGKSEAEVATIEFIANLDFAEPLMSGKEFMDYVLAKNAGGPLSWATLHELARRHKITEKAFEDEKREIESEGPTDAEIQRELDEERRREQEAQDSKDGETDPDETTDE